MNGHGLYISIYLINFEDLYWWVGAPVILLSSDHVFALLIFSTFKASVIGVRETLSASFIVYGKEDTPVTVCITETNIRPAIKEP
jgi:hypothetical protein